MSRHSSDLQKTPFATGERYAHAASVLWSSVPPYMGGHLLPGSAAQDVPFPLYKMHTIRGHAVETPQGKDVGHIQEVVIDAATGHVVYAVLAFKGILQPVEKLFALPWQALQQSAGLGTFMLDADAKALQEAPGFDNAQWPQQAQSLGSKGE